MTMIEVPMLWRKRLTTALYCFAVMFFTGCAAYRRYDEMLAEKEKEAQQKDRGHYLFQEGHLFTFKP